MIRKTMWFAKEVWNIKQLLAMGYSVKEISKMTFLCRSHIKKLIRSGYYE